MNVYEKSVYLNRQWMFSFHKQKRNLIITPDEEVAMILSTNKDDGPTSSKRARLITNTHANSSNDDLQPRQYHPTENRSMGHRRNIWDDSSDSDSPLSGDAKGLFQNWKLPFSYQRLHVLFFCFEKVYPNVDAYLSSIAEFDVREHDRIPYYMELLGDNAKEIQTELPESDTFTAEQMEVIKNNFILSQLDYLIRENVRRTTKEAKKEAKRLSLVKPLATVATEQAHKSEFKE